MRGAILPLPHTSSWRGVAGRMGKNSGMNASGCGWSPDCYFYVRGPFEKFVFWRQCAAVMQREAVTVMPSCSGVDNVVVV